MVKNNDDDGHHLTILFLAFGITLDEFVREHPEHREAMADRVRELSGQLIKREPISVVITGPFAHLVRSYCGDAILVDTPKQGVH